MSVVALIDDDDSIRRALARRLGAAGYTIHAFASAQDFLAAGDVAADCIVTDLQMPGMSGLELQAALARAGRVASMVFITGHGDVPASVQAMRAGAVHFITKPFADTDLLAALQEATTLSARRAQARAEEASVAQRYGTLTPREREVFALVVQGLLNKVIGDRLGAAEKTIKIHRARVMAKMDARSVADLVRMADRLPGTGGAAAA